MCRGGQPLECPDFSFSGYFARSQAIMKAYPYGGFGQFMTAPVGALEKSAKPAKAPPGSATTTMTIVHPKQKRVEKARATNGRTVAKPIKAKRRNRTDGK